MSLFRSHSSSGGNSLFSGSTGAPSPHHKFDWGDAALSFMGVDPNIFINRRRQQDAEAQQAQVAAIIDADPNLSPQDKAYAKLNPKAYLDNYMQRFQPMNAGPGGASRGLPGVGGQITSWQTAPRFDDNGTIYGPGNGTSAPPVLQRGTKTVPYQQGGGVAVFDALNAQRLDAGGAPQVKSKAEVDALPPGTEYIAPDGSRRVKAGGPSPGGSATFP